jgi:DNA polymerase delta subunit 1
MFRVTNVNDLESLYCILREEHPNNQLDVVYNFNTKEYTISVSKKPYTRDPEVPVDLNIEVVYGDTDSVFCKFKYNRDNFELNRRDTFEIATLCGDKLTNEIFNRKPIELEFEKVFHPFILLTKKRYIAKKFENPKDPFQCKGVDAKGIALTRRDYCKMVKNCYSEVIDTIMDTSNPNNLRNSANVYKKYVDKIDNYDIDTEDLVVSAMLAKEYSCKLCKKKSEWVLKCENKRCGTPNPEKLDSCKKCKTKITCAHTFSLAHINLAQELLRRNEEVLVGDRIAYIFVESDNAKAQKNELAEDPKYAEQHNIKLYTRGARSRARNHGCVY